MTIVVDWGDASDTFLIWRFEHGWTWDALYPALAQTDQMVAEHTGFDMLIDLRSCNTSQPNLLSHLTRIVKRTPHNLRTAVIVTNNDFLNYLHRMLQAQTVLPFEVYLVGTMDEGYSLIVRD
jgi:hypothetical protein